jgi:hypothetical protein
MTTPFNKLVDQFDDLVCHLRNREWSPALMTVKQDPFVMKMRDDKNLQTPMEFAIKYTAPLDFIMSMVEEWSQFQDLEALNELMVLHVACKTHAPLDVVRYLSSTFPRSKTFKVHGGYYPLQIALEEQLEEEVLECVMAGFKNRVHQVAALSFRTN